MLSDGKVLITLTSLLIDLDIIKTQVRVFESFVDVLFDTISKVNSGPDRILRETVRSLSD